MSGPSTIQRYLRGTRVRIAKELHDSMRYFAKDCDAVVAYTYLSRYGGGPEQAKQYGLGLIDDNGNVSTVASWYPEEVLTAVPGYSRDDGDDLLEQFELRLYALQFEEES